MSRRTQYITAISGVLLTSVGAINAAEKDERPNIVLINIDDLGWSDLSYNGSEYYETPNIDKLHSQGVSFNVAYAAAANSAPSRASMLSGLYSPRHGVYTVGSSARGRVEERNLIPVANNLVLPDSTVTLPMALRGAGFATCHIGKWHVGEDPLTQGMDVNIGGSHWGSPKGYFAPYKNPNLKDGPKGECLTTRLGSEAAQYIDTISSEKPFFLYYAPYAVHTPIQASRSITEKYRAKKGTEAHNNPAYAAMIEAMDNTVGMIMDALSSRGILEETVIVFTSDNGGVYNISKQWPLRAGKGSFYEGGIRVPFIIYQKGVIEDIKVDDIAVSQLDIFPTFMEIADASYSNKLDGVSLLPLLEGGSDKMMRNRVLYWHFPAYLEGGNAETKDPTFRSRPVSVIQHKNWKLIENYEDGSLELYNLDVDPSERTDLSEKEVKRVKSLYKRLNCWKREVKAELPTLK